MRVFKSFQTPFRSSGLQPINFGAQRRRLSQSANPLNPRTYGLDEAYATDLAIGIRDQLNQTDPLARALIARTGIDGMSLGALNPPAWYSLVMFSNILRTQLAGMIDPSDLSPLDGFTHTAGEGNIPNQDGDFLTKKLLRDASGAVVNLFCPVVLSSNFSICLGTIFERG